MKRTKIFPVVISLLLVLLFFAGGYTTWNMADPERTCASCHEISPSVTQWQHSAHRNVNCFDCHGTALSNGMHSLKEKANMVFTHVGEDKNHEDIRMTESQVLELSERCASCHTSEHAHWAAGGHGLSASYEDIFMDEAHNKMETPYWDCFRCHGMYYDGNIKDLLIQPETADGKWNFKDEEMAHVPTIPCLSCHQVHTENQPLFSENNLGNDQAKSDSISRNSTLSWYIRTDKRHQRADKLMKVAMMDNGKTIKVSDDPAVRLCQQCHSPNFAHQVGSEDDRTPSGVHEGISCIVCHNPHSNSATNSCSKCHPGISNCKLDVRAMNTSYADPLSTNNIHTVSCNDCHTNNEIINR
jgi:hypothetical protein